MARLQLQCETHLAELLLAGKFCDASILCIGVGNGDEAKLATPERLPVVRAVLAAASSELEERFALESTACELELPLTANALRCVIVFCCGAVPRGFHVFCSAAELKSAAALLDLPGLDLWCCEQRIGPYSEHRNGGKDGAGAAILQEVDLISAPGSHAVPIIEQSNRFLLVSSAFLTFLGWIAWKPCLGFKMFNNGFFMDDNMVARNPNVYTELDFRRLIRTDYWGLQMFEGTWTHKSFRPLSVLTFRLNYMLHGFESSGWHLTNLSLHAGCSVLLGCFAVLGLHLPVSWASLLSMLFFVHPVHTENVLYIVGRADLLCCALILLSCMIYGRLCLWNKTIGPKHVNMMLGLLLSSILIVAAGLCKETGFCFFSLLIGWEILRALRGDAQSPLKVNHAHVVRIVALLILGGSACSARVWYTGGTTIERMDPHSNPVVVESARGVRILSYALVHGVYGKLLVWPTFLSYDYSFDAIPLVRTARDVRLLLPLATYSVFANSFCLAMHVLRSCPKMPGMVAHANEAPIVGLAILVLSFVPMSNIFFPVGTMIGERLLYIPSMGMLITCVGLGHWAQCRFRGLLRHAGAAVLIAAGVGSTWLTMQRVPIWSSPEAITVADAKTQLRSSRVQYNLASHYANTKRFDEALTTFRNVISIDPTGRDSMPLYHAGQILLSQGRHAESEQYLALAVAGYFSPLMISEEEVFHDYALSKWFVGDVAGAIENFEKSLIINGTFAKGFNNLGCAEGLGALLGKVPQQQFAHGLQAVQMALQLDPSSILYRQNIVGLLLLGGENELATQAWHELVALDPSLIANGPPQDCIWEFNFR